MSVRMTRDRFNDGPLGRRTQAALAQSESLKTGSSYPTDAPQMLSVTLGVEEEGGKDIRIRHNLTIEGIESVRTARDFLSRCLEGAEKALKERG